MTNLDKDFVATANELIKDKIVFNFSPRKIWLIEGEQKQEISLTGKEFDILAFLAKNEGQLFKREHIIEAIWGESTFVLGRTIDTHVSKIRKKLGHYHHYLQCISGEGYRFRAQPPHIYTYSKPQ